jgi:hypothetical protein
MPELIEMRRMRAGFNPVVKRPPVWIDDNRFDLNIGHVSCEREGRTRCSRGPEDAARPFAPG